MTDEQNNVSLHPASLDNLFVLPVLLFVASTSYPQPIDVNSTGKHCDRNVVDHCIKFRCCSVGSVERVRLLFG
jgi:hypothetical protein